MAVKFVVFSGLGHFGVLDVKYIPNEYNCLHIKDTSEDWGSYVFPNICTPVRLRRVKWEAPNMKIQNIEGTYTM